MTFVQVLLLSMSALLVASCTNTVPEISESFQFNGIVFGGKTTTNFKVASTPACSSALTVVGECDARVSGMKFSLDAGQNWTSISSLTNGSDGSCTDGKFSIIFSDICASFSVATAENVTKKILLSGVTLTGTQSQGSVTVQFEPVTTVPVLPQVSISNAPTALEGTSASFSILLAQASTQTVTVDYGTSNTTASVTDYTSTTGTLTFAPGETTKTILVPVLADSLYENAAETFVLTLINPVNAELGSASAIATITDADTAPVIQFAAASQNFLENAGTATVTLTPSVASANSLTIPYTVSGTATGGGVDYTLASGNIVLPANAVSVSLTFPVVNDATIEVVSETVVLTLGALPFGTVGAVGVHTLSIIDDDLPNVSIDDVNINEGGTLTFTITLSAISPAAVAINWASGNGSAIAGADYTAASGQVVIPAGDTTTNVVVNTIDNGIVCQAARTVNMNLGSATGAVIVDSQGIGSIDDPDRPTLSVSNVSGAEGAIINMNATLSAACPLYPVTFTWATTAGTATTTTDFVSVNASTTIPAGQTTQTLSVTTISDLLNEGDESFTVTLGALTEATFSGGISVATFTILDDDGQPTLSIISPASVTEGLATSFTVLLSAISAQVITVNYATTSGTAVAGTDFVAGSGSVTFNPGVSSQPISISTLANPVDDLAAKNFTVTLSGATNATISTPTGTGTINDGDAPSATSISVEGGATYSKTALVTLSLGATNATHMYVTPDATCSSSGVYETYSATKAYTLTALNQTTTVSVKFKDAFGNVSACIPDTIIHDSTAPSTPSSLTLFSPVSSPGVNLTPTLRVAGLTVGDTVRIHLGAGCGGAPISTSSVTVGTMDLTIPSLAGDGFYNFYADSLDPATNPSGCSGPLVYQVLRDLTDDDNSILGFGGGTFTQTMFSGGELKLNAGSSGQFVSRVMDGTQNVSWLNMQWMPSFPTMKALPDSGSMEFGYPIGNADMSGNRLLYHFDEGFYVGSATEVIDTSGFGSHGTAQPFTNSIMGVYGSAAEFMLGRGAISVPHNASLNFSSPLTVEAWIKPSTVIDLDSSQRVGLVDKGFFSLGINSRAQVQFDVQTTGGSGSTVVAKNFSSGPDSTQVLMEYHGVLYGGVESSGTAGVDVYGCVPAADGTCTSWLTSINSSGFSAARAAIVYRDRLYIGLGASGLSFGDIQYCSSESFSGNSTYCDGADWSTSFDGTDMAYVTAFAVFKNRLYASFIKWTGQAVVKVCNPATAGDPIHCDANTDWSDAATTAMAAFSSELNYDGAYSMAVMGDHLYVGMGGTNSANGDLYMCSTADGVCDSASEWTKSYNSTAAADTVTSLLEMNDVLYIGLQGTQAALRRCDPKTVAPLDQCTSADATTLLYTAGTADSVESMASFGGKLYVGLGWISINDGRYLVFDPTLNGNALLADSLDASGLMSLTGINYNSIPAIYGFNGRLYFGTAGNSGGLFGDIFYLDKAAASVKSARQFLSQTEWTHVVGVYDGATVSVYVNGILEGATPLSGSLLTSNSPVIVGKYIGGSGDNSMSTNFVGGMDELAIYNRSLNASDVWDRYHRGATRVEIEVRSCSLPNCADGLFVGSSGFGGSYFSEEFNGFHFPLPPQNLINVPFNRYFQYRVNFSMDPDAQTSPGLRSVTIDNSN